MTETSKQEQLPAEVAARETAVQILTESEAVLARANAIVTVRNAAEYESAVEVLRKIAASLKEQQAERLEITRPMDAAKARIMKLFETRMSPLQAVDKLIRAKLKTFDDEQKRLADQRRQEAEARAQREREEAQRKAREAEEAARKRAEAERAEADRIAREQREAAEREAQQRRQAAEAARQQEEAAAREAEQRRQAAEQAAKAAQQAREREEAARREGDKAAAAAAAKSAQAAIEAAEFEQQAAAQASKTAAAAAAQAQQEEAAAATVVRKADETAQAVVAKAERKAETIVQRGTAKAEQLQAHAQTIVAPVITEDRPKVAGSARVKKWQWRVKEEKEVNRKFLKLDESKIGGIVRQMGKDAEEIVGGIEVWDENTHRITAAK